MQVGVMPLDEAPLLETPHRGVPPTFPQFIVPRHEPLSAISQQSANPFMQRKHSPVLQEGSCPVGQLNVLPEQVIWIIPDEDAPLEDVPQ